MKTQSKSSTKTKPRGVGPQGSLNLNPYFAEIIVWLSDAKKEAGVLESAVIEKLITKAKQQAGIA